MREFLIIWTTGTRRAGTNGPTGTTRCGRTWARISRHRLGAPKNPARATIVTHPRWAYERLVTASAALDQQIERYRQMTGEERLSIALGLHEMSCDIAREGIRHGHPGADPAAVERLLHRRLELARAG